MHLSQLGQAKWLLAQHLYKHHKMGAEEIQLEIRWPIENVEAAILAVEDDSDGSPPRTTIPTNDPKLKADVSYRQPKLQTPQERAQKQRALESIEDSSSAIEEDAIEEVLDDEVLNRQKAIRDLEKRVIDRHKAKE